MDIEQVTHGSIHREQGLLSLVEPLLEDSHGLAK